MKSHWFFKILAGMVILCFVGCAPTLYVTDKVIGAGLNKMAEKQKAEAAKAEDKLLESWWLTKTYVAVYKVGDKIEIRALKKEGLEWIGKTEYNLDMDKYLAMSKDQKKIHIREYFKARTGLDLDPTLEPETAEKSPAPSPNIPLPDFAPTPNTPR